jgi:hypothetical protein
MKYVAIRDSYGFMKRLWLKGDIVELPDNVVVNPKRFAPILSEKPPVPAKEEPKPEVEKEHKPAIQYRKKNKSDSFGL